MPGFHSWFVRKRAPIFQHQVVGEALDRLQLDTRFTTSHLEVTHKIQKKNTAETNSGLEVTVLKTLHQWHLSFERETERAFYGQGKFRLAPGYEQFYREPSIYLPWSQERKQDHMRKFLQFTPSIKDTYKKPSNAGLKAPPVKKTRRNQDVAELFHDHIVVSARETAFCLNCKKAGDTGDWVSGKSNKPRHQGNELVALDPFRMETNLYHLVHRDDTRKCPKKVTRYECYKMLFTNTDIVLIKTKGKRQFTCPKKEKEKCHVANVYLQHLQSCLKDCDGKFRLRVLLC